MINSGSLSLPYLDGAVTVLVDDGSTVVDEGALYRALASYDKSKSFPQDATLDYAGNGDIEITLRTTFPEGKSIDRVAIEGLNVTDGMGVSVLTGDGTTMTAFSSSITPTEDDLYETQSFLFRDDPVTATVVDITFSGLSGALVLAGLMVGKNYWTPDYNFSYGDSQNKGLRLDVVETDGGAVGIARSRVRSLTLTFANQSFEKAEALTLFCSRRIVEGYCLFEQDQTTDSEWFLCVANAPSYTHVKFNRYTAQMKVTAVNECQ